jgi:tetratricopeptide (TPR) repeat protein
MVSTRWITSSAFSPRSWRTSMTDDIRRWSDELARDPGSLVFLRLGEALRRQGQPDVAMKIALRGLDRHPNNVDAHDLLARVTIDLGDLSRAAQEWEAVLRIDPNHLGALKGLGFVSYQHGRLEEAERYLQRAASLGAGDSVAVALNTVRRSGEISSSVVEAEMRADSRWLFADLLTDEEQTAILVDENGYVLGGIYLDSEGRDLAQEIGAQLSGISDEAVRATRHLDIGVWRSITFETDVASIAMAPTAYSSVVVVAVSRATPLGLLRRLLDRCGARAGEWLRDGAMR